ncbi:nSTAND3 domain-containing NTPase [Nonomuraea helvata]|uniref:Novel STAND NTPase 3 domain-containing protein n=1 Tax=Nonomuraea helvata TaxID=37484 RepID=A0ABV5RS08_9ACTN
MADAEARSRKARLTSIKDLDWLWQRFVHPPGYGQAHETLATHRLLLLDGEPGSGRTTAAKVLLRELSSGGERFYELSWEDENGKYQVEPDFIVDDDRVWLDLSRADEGTWHALQEDLSSLRKRVDQHGALLVVVLPVRGSETLRPEFGQFHSWIKRPSAHEVLRRHLRLEGVPEATTSPQPAFLSTDRAMLEVAGFAGFVRKAYENAPGAGYLAWYKAAESASTGRGADVATAVSKLRLGPQRALLLATAMLHQAHVDHVYSAAAALLESVEYADERHTLERSDLVESLDHIGAKLDSNRHVRFRELGYDAAVRTHFWHNMPGLRDGIQRWVAAMVDHPELDEMERDDLVMRFAEQCLHPRYRQTLVDSVTGWTRGSKTYRRQMAADRALRHALSVEEHGRFFRQQIYNWATDRRTSEALAQVIIMMCTDVIAVTHPDQAIVRLHHLARRESQSTDARTALLGMVAGDPWMLRHLLQRLTRLPTVGRQWDIDIDLFLELANPAAFTDPVNRNRPLIAEADVRDMLAEGWRRAFHERGEVAWKPGLRQWLIAAFHDDRHRDALIGVLVAGGEQRGGVLGRLYTEARALPRFIAGGRERSAAFVDLVLRKICTAQGIQVT